MRYIINLQLFSESEKTEQATPKKKRDARREGQVLQSKEVTATFILIVSFIGLKVFGEYALNNLTEFITSLYPEIENVDSLFHENNLKINALKLIVLFLSIAGPVILFAFAAALIINYAQVGFLFTTKPLGLKLNRLNPVEGFKRMFSKKSIMELLKSILKIIIVGYVGYSFIVDNMNRIINLSSYEINLVLVNMTEIIFDFVFRILFVMAIIAGGDYFFQWRQHQKSLMMTKQEIKEEYKQTEGDPQIKSKIRERQRTISNSRMMQQVPKADVIITNPTHLAVAIKYDKDLYNAPYVIAKGADLIAENIKKVAIENNVAIVENKPVARALYDSLDIGDLIPEDLYEAIAEILAYVYSLKDMY